jgi:predicted Rossmann fold flavoprotein
MGATGLGYQIAEQFGHNLYPRLPALVPFTLNPKMLKDFNGLSGTSIFAEATCNQQSFKENLLLTHRGISGPVILQISSYWQAGDEITINLLPNNNIYNDLKQAQQHTPNSQLNTLLSEYFSKKLATRLCELWFNNFYEHAIANLSDKQLQNVAKHLHHWCFKPAGTEGYRKAEVTLGGINTDEISSKTFESKKTEGLYFIGEVLDVTGQLGGYNFQWAWASGHAAGQSI